MSNILINGLRARTGGGKSILNNYLALLKESNSPHKYVVLTPEIQEYRKYSSKSIQIVDIAKVLKMNVLFPFLYCFAIPRLLESYQIDVIFNLGDIVIPSRLPQVYLFDWAYAVYPNSTAWNRMDISNRVFRKMKLRVFKKWLSYASVVIAQTDTMKARLDSLYGLRNVEVIPNAVSLDNMTGGEYFDFGLPEQKIKLLYLACYYPHKNLEVLLPLAREISEMSLPYCVVVTLDPAQHRNAKRFLSRVLGDGLDGTIINIGSVPMEFVPSLYSQCDALLMPTLLESFSGTYVEAMFHRKVILTSDLDFARDVCGQAAFYFNPLKHDDILSSINCAFAYNAERAAKIDEGSRQLGRLLTWEQAFERFQSLLENSVTRET